MPAPGASARRILLTLGIAIAPVYAQTPAVQSFSSITSITPLTNGLELHDGPLTLRVTALRNDVIRIRGSRTATLPEDASWAVLPEARTASILVTQDSNDTTAAFHTAALHVAIDRTTGLLTLTDNTGNVLRQDTQPLEFRGPQLHLANAMPADEHYFGLGDKTGAFDRREQAYRLWNTDAYGWQESTDPLYKSIPFYLTYRAGVSLGVLIDNTFASSFDFGKTLTDTFQYRAEGGPADIYLLYGPSAKQVLGAYAWLTGPTPLPPLWSLGFQQSRFSYMTRTRVLEVANRLRKDHIPTDALYLDIDYQQNNRPFTINSATFPDMPGLINTLHHDNFHVVAITDLHIAHLPNQNYAPYDSGTAGDHFLKNPDDSQYVGPVWPGPSVFPDFTQQKTRNWWGTLYRSFTQMGIDGFWNDMNEPSVFNALKTVPCSILHRIDEPGFTPRIATHCEVHNVYGMENSRATFDGQLALKPGTRPFVLTRATYAGGQRYAATWTGDDSATWNQLRLTTSMLKNLGLSGFSLAGADVGGYAGTPSPDLLTKWIEIGAFQPIDRDHAEKGTGDHEVWANGPAQEVIRRRFIEERYKLLPYLYTVAEEGTRTGLPILRPLFLEFPNAAPDHHPLDIDLPTSGEFMVGPDLLIAPPPFLDKVDDYDATLPSTGWYDYWTGAPTQIVPTRALSGDLLPDVARHPPLPAVHLHPELAVLPVFARPGAIIPTAPIVQSTHDQPTGPLTLRVFPGPNCSGSLYQDDGTTFAYKHGDFLRIAFTCNVSPPHGQLSIHIGKQEGTYPAWWHQIAVQINGISNKPTALLLDGHPTAFTHNNHSLTVTVDDPGKGFDILIP